MEIRPVSQGHCGNVPAQRRQTVLHGAVQLGAVDIQTDAAQHRRVDLCLQVDGLAGEGFQLLVQGSRLLFGQGNGRGVKPSENTCGSLMGKKARAFTVIWKKSW